MPHFPDKNKSNTSSNGQFDGQFNQYSDQHQRNYQDLDIGLNDNSLPNLPHWLENTPLPDLSDVPPSNRFDGEHQGVTAEDCGYDGPPMPSQDPIAHGQSSESVAVTQSPPSYSATGEDDPEVNPELYRPSRNERLPMRDMSVTFDDGQRYTPAVPPPFPIGSVALKGYERDKQGRIIIPDHLFHLGKVTNLSHWTITPDGVVLQALTGRGKSTLVINFAKYLWDKYKIRFMAFMPTTILCDQLADGHDHLQVIKGGEVPVFDDPGIYGWICTYDSAAQGVDLIGKYAEHFDDPYLDNVFIMIDEHHHFSSDGYRKRIDPFLRRLRATRSPKLFTSATPPQFIPYFPHPAHITFVSETPKEVMWHYFIGSTPDAIDMSLTEGRTPFVNMNDKRLAEAYKRAYENQGLTVQLVTADNKDEIMKGLSKDLSDCDGLLTKEEGEKRGLIDGLLPKADIYICTAVLNDGMSIYNLEGDIDVTISPQSLMTHSRYIVQFTARPRHSSSARVLLTCKDEEDYNKKLKNERPYTEKDEARNKQKLDMIADNFVAFVESQMLLLESMASDDEREAEESAIELIEQAFGKVDWFYIDEETGRPKKNETAVIQAVDRDTLRAQAHSKATMEYWLAKHDFVYGGVIRASGASDIDDDVIKHSNVLSAADRAEKMRIASTFRTFEEAKQAARETPPSNYSECYDLVDPIEVFVEKERESAKKKDEDVSEEEITTRAKQSQRKAIRDTTKGSVLRIQTAKDIVRMTNIQCNANEELIFTDAFQESRAMFSETVATPQLFHVMRKKAAYKKVLSGLDSESCVTEERRMINRIDALIQFGEQPRIRAVRAIIREEASRNLRLRRELLSEFDTTSEYQFTPKPEPITPDCELTPEPELTGDESHDEKLWEEWEEENADVLLYEGRLKRWREENNEGMARHQAKKEKADKWEHDRAWELLHLMYKVKRERMFIDGKAKTVKVPVGYHFDGEEVSNSIESQTERLDDELRWVVVIGQPCQEVTDKVFDAHSARSEYLAQKFDTPRKRKLHLSKLFVFKRRQIKGLRMRIPVSTR